MLIRSQRPANTAESTNSRRHASSSNLLFIVLTRVRLSISAIQPKQGPRLLS